MSIVDTKTNKSFLGKLHKNKELLFLASPGFVIILIYYYLPMIGTIIAFKEYKYDKGIIFSEYVGLKNFRFFFTSQYASRILFNTILLNVIFIFSTLVLSVFVAILLNEMKTRKYSKFAQSCMFLPYFISWVVVGYFAIALFNETYGVLNQTLHFFGIDSISWYNEPKYWPLILTIFNIWKQLGVNTVIYLAALTNISEEYYDASKIDGANKVQQVFYITLPSITPIMSIMVLLSIGQIFRSDFGLFYNVTGDIGALYSTTDVIDTFVVRSLRVIGDVGMASAASFIQSIAGLLLVTASNLVVKKINPDNALF